MSTASHGRRRQVVDDLSASNRLPPVTRYTIPTSTHLSAVNVVAGQQHMYVRACTCATFLQCSDSYEVETIVHAQVMPVHTQQQQSTPRRSTNGTDRESSESDAQLHDCGRVRHIGHMPMNAYIADQVVGGEEIDNEEEDF